MARSAWLRHVMAVRGKNKGMAFKDVLKLAKKSYKKGGGSKFESQPAEVSGGSPEPENGNDNASKGEDSNGTEEAAPQEGGRRRRRRRSRKSRRSRKGGRKSRRSRKGGKKSRRSRKTKRRRRRRR